VSKKKFFSLLLISLIFTVPGAGKNSVASRAPFFTLPTQTGSVSLYALRGKVVYVDFWASWCMPCRNSFPWMKSIYERYSPRGFEIVAINLDKNREYADKFLQEFYPPFTVAFDPQGKSAEAFEVPTMPSSFLISRKGNIVYSHAGFDEKKADLVENVIQEECSK
jgi:thiol-disulfide isomerase/thioredoxin